MNSTEEKVFCTKCGAEMNGTSRCCLKCGNLNPLHKDNQAYFEKLAEIHGTSVDTAVSYVQQLPTPTQAAVPQPTAAETPLSIVSEQVVVQAPLKDNSSSFLACNIVNFIFLLIGLFFVFLAFQSLGLDSVVGIIMLLVGISTLMIFGLEVLYLEMEQSWWAVFVPVYGNMVLAEITMGNMMIGLLTLIPVVGEFALFVMMYQLGEKIGKNSIITLLFFPFVVALYGFNACSYVCGKPKKDSINRFFHKGIYYISFLLFIGGIVIAFLF